jgi:hypothetical protein
MPSKNAVVCALSLDLDYAELTRASLRRARRASGAPGEPPAPGGRDDVEGPTWKDCVCAARAETKGMNLFHVLCLYMIGDSIGAAFDLGVVKVAITVGGPPSADADHTCCDFVMPA